MQEATIATIGSTTSFAGVGIVEIFKNKK